MRKTLFILTRIAIYLLAFLAPPLLVGFVGMYAAETGAYEKAPHAATSFGAQEAPAPPTQDTTKPTAVVLMSNEGAQVTDVLAPYEVLSESGAFNVYAAAPQREAVPLGGGLDVLPQLSLGELDRRLGGKDPDVIVVPAMPEVGTPEDRPVAQWLKDNSKGDTTILSVCNGAEALADAGLLDGRSVTANWARIDGFKKRYPETEWVRGLRYVEDGNLVSTAGITSGINGTLHVVSEFIGDEAAEELAREIGYPDRRIGASPEIPVNRMTTSDGVLFVLNAAYRWNKPSIGVVLNEGVGEIELASVIDVYPGEAFTADTTTLAPGGPRTTVTSEHGLAFVPRFDLEDASDLDRLLVPGREAPSATDPALRAWARERGLKPEYVHAESVGSSGASFPFNATLTDLAKQENVPIARFTAKALEYPTDHLDLAGPGWPLSLLLGPLAVGLLSLLLVTGLDRLLMGLLTARQRRGPKGGPMLGTGPGNEAAVSARRAKKVASKRTPLRSSIATGHRGATAKVGSFLRKVGYFLWHLLQMVLAMMAGMAIYGVLSGMLPAASAYAALLVAYPPLEYPVMFAFMTPPMVALMRYHGYNWRHTTEMVGAMLGPPAVIITLVLCGASDYLPWLSVGTLGLSTHIAMLVGMILWMLYRLTEIQHLVQHNSHRRDDPPAAQQAV